jgi:hypothetical protein
VALMDAAAVVAASIGRLETTKTFCVWKNLKLRSNGQKTGRISK